MFIRMFCQPTATWWTCTPPWVSTRWLETTKSMHSSSFGILLVLRSHRIQWVSTPRPMSLWAYPLLGKSLDPSEPLLSLLPPFTFVELCGASFPRLWTQPTWLSALPIQCMTMGLRSKSFPASSPPSSSHSGSQKLLRLFRSSGKPCSGSVVQ